MISKTDAKGVTISYSTMRPTGLRNINFPTRYDIVYVYDTLRERQGPSLLDD